MEYRLIDEILGLMYDVGFFNNKLTDYTEMADSLTKSYREPSDHHFIVKGEFAEILSHIAAFRFHKRDFMIHHMVARPGNGSESLMAMAIYLVGRGYDMDWVHSYYRPDNRWPNGVFGGIAEAAPDHICSEKPYGYKIHNPFLAMASGLREDGPLKPFYFPLRLEQIPGTLYFDRPDYYSTCQYKAYTNSGDYIGILTRRRSIPWLNASNLLNCDIFDLEAEIEFEQLISFDPSNIYPILWNPVEMVTNTSPDKIYNHWKIKMDKESYQYFGL
jgi:hypothetical protein